jgi:hypothetical protein
MSKSIEIFPFSLYVNIRPKNTLEKIIRRYWASIAYQLQMSALSTWCSGKATIPEACTEVWCSMLVFTYSIVFMEQKLSTKRLTSGSTRLQSPSILTSLNLNHTFLTSCILKFQRVIKFNGQVKKEVK